MKSYLKAETTRLDMFINNFGCSIHGHDLMHSTNGIDVYETDVKLQLVGVGAGVVPGPIPFSLSY